MVAVGVTTDEINIAVHDFIVKSGGYPSPLNYNGFRKSICTSVNEVICHGIPDNRPLQDGDIVNLDITVYYKGVHADLNETYGVGTISNASIHLIKTAYRCMDEAMKICKPDTLYRECGNVIGRIAKEEGLSVVRSYCGHGIGEHFHTDPSIAHYAKNKTPGIMKKGNCFTIEPMINMGTWRDNMWADNWTVVTQDGKRSAQFEHTMIITDDGIEVVTKRLPDSPPLDFEI